MEEDQIKNKQEKLRLKIEKLKRQRKERNKQDHKQTIQYSDPVVPMSARSHYNQVKSQEENEKSNIDAPRATLAHKFSCDTGK